MKKEIKVENRKSTFVDLEDFCHHSLGDRKGKGDFLEVTEWSNGDGYDAVGQPRVPHARLVLGRAIRLPQ